MTACLLAGVMACAAAQGAPASPALPAEPGLPVAADVASGTHALRLLLGMANEPIPTRSSCHAAYGQRGRARVKDLLATQLAVLHAGNNVVQGGCGAASCSVVIRHAAGEDLSSATIQFQLRQGRPQAASLRCLMTP